MANARRISHLPIVILLLSLINCLLSYPGVAHANLIEPSNAWLDTYWADWETCPTKYAAAFTLAGPWTEFKNIAPAETNTYGAQSTLLVKVVDTEKMPVLFLGDIWKPNTQCHLRNLRMPLNIGDS